LARYDWQDHAADPHEIEALLSAPVLGAVSRINQALPSANPEDSLDFERTVTALKIKMEDASLRAIGFTGLSTYGANSLTLANIARMLSNCNYSVLLMDADFRDSKLAKEFGILSNRLPDLKELLLHAASIQQHAMLQPVGNATGLDSQTSPEQWLPAHDYITRIPDEKNLYLMSGSQSIGNPYEVVTSKYFPQVIEQMKSQFDFVLVNLPPVLEIPDGIITARLLDGLTAICSQQTARTDLKALRKLCTDHAVNLVGVITRHQAE
jgi:Mrp family chromosome partitioning ATPase